MKKFLLYTAAFIFSLVLYVFALGVSPRSVKANEVKPVPVHVCSDTTHASCDGNCECDGLGCFKPAF